AFSSVIWIGGVRRTASSFEVVRMLVSCLPLRMLISRSLSRVCSPTIQMRSEERRVFRSYLGRRPRARRFFRRGCADVGGLLALEDVYLKVVVAGMLADDPD